MPPDRRRRFRFTIGRMMLALPVIALIIVLIAGIDPFARDPNRDSIDRAIESCRDEPFTFDATYRYDWAHPGAAPVLDKPPLVDGRCLLRIAMPRTVIHAKKNLWVFGTYGALADDGREQTWHRSNMGEGGGSGERAPEQMAAIRRILPTLPPSAAEIPRGPDEMGHWTTVAMTAEVQGRFESRALVIGFRVGQSWATRVYDRRHLPPEVAALLDNLGFTLD